MSGFEEKYPEIHKIFSPGYVIKDIRHPVIDKLNHPLFIKIIRYTDQVIFIINHTTFTYEYISDNVMAVYGRTPKDLNLASMADSYHPDDFPALQSKVFPAYLKCFSSLSPEDQLRMILQYNYRVRHIRGHYMQIHQKNIPLTVERGKVILGMAICTDVSAYKKDNNIYFRNTVVRDSGEKIELENNMNDIVTSVLTPREVEILSLTASGFSEKQIADQLFLSIHTIKTHRKNMVKKAGVKNAAELVRFGIANFII